MLVAFVEVVFPKFPFHLSAEEPRESAASRDGRRFVSTKPFTPRLVVVTLVAVAFVRVTPWRFETPVTAKVESTLKAPVDVPPLNTIELVVVFPEFVTVWKFGDVPLGQFVPFARQTAVPLTAMDEALIEEPEAFVKPSHEDVTPVNIPLTAVRLSDDNVGRFANVAWSVVANKFVLVVFVPVAFVHVKFVKFDGVAPVTVSVETMAFVKFAFSANVFVEVEFVVVTSVNIAVDGVIPPMDVPLIVPPVIVTFDEERFGAVRVVIVPDVELKFVTVPFVPVRLEKLPVRAFTRDPLAVSNPSHVVVIPVNVPFVEVRLVTAALFDVSVSRFEFVAWKLVANKFVLVVFVPVAFNHVRFVKKDCDVDETFKFETTRF